MELMIRLPRSVPDHEHHHDDRDQDLLADRRVQRAQGLLDQPRAVVEGHDRHLTLGAVGQDLGRQAARDRRDRAPSRARWWPSGSRRSAPRPRRRPPPRRPWSAPRGAAAGPSATSATSRIRIGLAVARGDRGEFEVLDRLHEAHAAHHVLGAVHLDGAGADVEVAAGARRRSPRQADVRPRAWRRDRRRPGTRGRSRRSTRPRSRPPRRPAVLHGEVLDRAQLVEVPAAGGIPRRDRGPRACTRTPGRGRWRRGRASASRRRQGARGQGVQLLEHARARPVELDAVLEHHVHGRRSRTPSSCGCPSRRECPAGPP